MHRDKSLKQFGLQQLIGEDCGLNTSSSAPLLNQSSFDSVSASFNFNKMNYPTQEQAHAKSGRYLSFKKKRNQKD